LGFIANLPLEAGEMLGERYCFFRWKTESGWVDAVVSSVGKQRVVGWMLLFLPLENREWLGGCCCFFRWKREGGSALVLVNIVHRR
jgi:hypothetical protein